MEVNCFNCAKLLNRAPSLIGRRVFCNRECRKLFHRPSITCRGCGNLFTKIVTQPNRQYCTWGCFKASRHVQLQCAVCGEQFSSYLCEQLKRERRGHTPCCSRSCRNSYTSRLLGGDGCWVPGGQYKPSRNRGSAWRKVRQAYLAAVGGRCEGCSAAPAVHVHHLHPVAAGGGLLDATNLMAVCKGCHDNMHWQLSHGHFWDSMEATACHS